MFADADEEHLADSRILNGYSLDDLDRETLNKYRQLFRVSSPDHPWLILDDVSLLKMLGGYRKDRQTGEEGFAVAGRLMFGKTEAITDVECTPNFFPDYQEHLTEDENVMWTNRICADGTWEANLFNFYQRVLPRLQSVLPKPFKLENNIHREETSFNIGNGQRRGLRYERASSLYVGFAQVKNSRIVETYGAKGIVRGIWAGYALSPA